jgi:hypothetical protein
MAMQPSPRPHTSHRIGAVLRRAVAASAITAALLAGTVGVGASVASAADTLPPDAAILTNAPVGLPSTAGSSSYWATDNCHYYELDGQWYADVCMRQPVDANGNVIPGVVGLFSNAGHGQVGAEQLRMDASMPGRISMGVPDASGAVSAWTTYVLATNQQGQQTWVQELPNTNPGVVIGGTRSGVPDVSGLSPAQQSQVLGLFQAQQTANFCATIIWISDSHCDYQVG